MKRFLLNLLFILISSHLFAQNCKVNANDIFICAGTQGTLSASGANTYQWYDAPSGGNLVSSQSTFTTPALNTTTTYYVVGIRDTCQSDPTPVTVNVVQLPDAPTSPSVSICAGSRTTLTATSPTGTVFDWYTTATGGNSLITSPDFTTPALNANTTYYVQTYNGGCPGPRTAVNITVNPVPQTPQSANQTICFNSAATLTATANGGTIKWYDSSFGNTPLATGDTFTTPVLTAPTTFYVETSNDQTGCTSQRIPVIVKLMQQVPHPTAPGQVICNGTATTLTATSTQNGTTFQWYDAETNGTLLTTGATFTTPVLTAASTTYYVQGTYQGCVSQRTAIVVSTTVMPTAPTVTGSTTICGGNRAALTATGDAASYEWYDAANGGTPRFTGITYITDVLNATTTFYVQGINGNCPSERTPVTVTVNPAPTAPTITGASATVCQGGMATLNASGSNITWFDSNGNPVAAGNDFTTPTLLTSTTYYAESSNGQCSSTRIPVPVTVTPVPNPAFTYSSGSFCKTAGGFASPIFATGVTGTYNFTSSPVGLVINQTTGRINIATSLPGNYTIVLTTSSNSCIRDMENVIITLAGEGSADFTYPPQTFCQYDPNPLPTFGPLAYGGNFTVTPLTGLVFVDNTTGEIDLSKSIPGTYVITNKVSCGTTVTTATSTIIISARTRVDAGPDQKVAIGAPVQLAGSKTGTGSVMWSTTDGGTFSDPTSPTSRYTPATGQQNPVTLTLTGSSQSSNCAPLSDQMVITFSPLDPPSAAGVTICQGQTAILTATGPAAGSSGDYQWYDASVGGNLLSSNNPYAVAPQTTTTYYLQTIVNGVTSARTPVLVTVNPVAVLTVTGNTICFDKQAMLSADANMSGGVYQWFDGNGILLATGNTYTTTFLQKNTRYFVQYTPPQSGAPSQNNAVQCPTPLVPVDVVVNPAPIITSGLTLSTCSAVAINYIITSNTPGTNYTWSRDPVNGIDNAATSGQTDNISETLINSTNKPINVVYNILASSSTCTSNPFKLVVTVNPALTFTSNDVKEICNGTSPDYQLTFNFQPTSISWSRAFVPGIRNQAISNQTSATIREILTNTTNAPVKVQYVYTAQSGGCATSTFNLAVTVDPTVKITSASSSSICTGNLFTYNITSNVTGATFNWTRAAIPGISNAAVSATSSSTISETLINTTTNPIAVRYLISPFYNLCPGTRLSYTLIVYPIPATPVINTDSRVCTGTSLNLNTASVAGATYAWTGPNNFTSALQNPVINNITAANAGDYTLTVTVNGCASATTTKTIGVDVQPVATAGPDQTVCAGYQIQLKGAVTGGTTNGVWTTTGTGTFSPSNTDLNAKYIPSAGDANLPSLTFTLSSAALDNCSISTSALTVTLTPPPTANAGGNQNICNQNTNIALKGIVSNANSFMWTTTGTGSFSPSANSLNPIYTMSAADLKNGSVRFLLSATNAYCTAYDEKLVTFLPPPVISAGNKKVNYVLKNSIFTLSPKVNETNVHYLWSPDTYLDNDTLKNAKFTAVVDQTLTLVVTDTLGCTSSDQISFIVLDPIVTYNTFTPNGDGQNDTWVIPSIIKYPGAKVDIYNRYGVQLFHSDGYGIPWDGTYQGQPVPVGVYYYVITTKFSPQIFSGYVTVLR